MDDDLERLKSLPRHAPSDELRRQVRVEMLDALAASEPVSWWERLWRQAAVPVALAAFSLFQLWNAAAHTPLLR